MDNFSFQCITKLCFGKDQQKKIGARIQPFAKKVLLVYGGGSIKKNGIYNFASDFKILMKGEPKWLRSA